MWPKTYQACGVQERAKCKTECSTFVKNKVHESSIKILPHKVSGMLDRTLGKVMSAAVGFRNERASHCM